MAPGVLPWPFYFQKTIMRGFGGQRKRHRDWPKPKTTRRKRNCTKAQTGHGPAQTRSAHTINREFLGTWANKKAIWSDKMRRFRKMKSSHKLGM